MLLQLCVTLCWKGIRVCVRLFETLFQTLDITSRGSVCGSCDLLTYLTVSLHYLVKYLAHIYTRHCSGQMSSFGATLELCFSVATTALGESTKLLYVEPG